MKEKPNYYAIIPANVRYDNELRDKAKLLYGEITSLANKDGYCFASNKYFAELYDVSTTTISTLISELVEKGYIESEIVYKEGTKEILNRYLKIFKEGYLKNFKHNNTSNIIINNNKKEIYKERNFIKPTLDEVKEYCKERNNDVDAERFINFYESKGWMVGKNKMKDWRACVRTWEKGSKSTKEELPSWFNKEIETDNITEEEEQEYKDILNSFE